MCRQCVPILGARQAPCRGPGGAYSAVCGGPDGAWCGLLTAPAAASKGGDRISIPAGTRPGSSLDPHTRSGVIHQRPPPIVPAGCPHDLASHYPGLPPGVGIRYHPHPVRLRHPPCPPTARLQRLQGLHHRPCRTSRHSPTGRPPGRPWWSPYAALSSPGPAPAYPVPATLANPGSGYPRRPLSGPLPAFGR